jgi:hypothetical protein
MLENCNTIGVINFFVLINFEDNISKQTTNYEGILKERSRDLIELINNSIEL